MHWICVSDFGHGLRLHHSIIAAEQFFTLLCSCFIPYWITYLQFDIVLLFIWIFFVSKYNFFVISQTCRSSQQRHWSLNMLTHLMLLSTEGKSLKSKKTSKRKFWELDINENKYFTYMVEFSVFSEELLVYNCISSITHRYRITSRSCIVLPPLRTWSKKCVQVKTKLKPYILQNCFLVRGGE